MFHSAYLSQKIDFISFEIIITEHMRQQNKYLSTAGVKCANHGEHFGMFKQLTTPAIAIFDLHAKFSLDI